MGTGDKSQLPTNFGKLLGKIGKSKRTTHIILTSDPKPKQITKCMITSAINENLFDSIFHFIYISAKLSFHSKFVIIARIYAPSILLFSFS